jgi:hypothetical protein
VRTTPRHETRGVDFAAVDVTLADEQDAVGRDHPVARRGKRAGSRCRARIRFGRHRHQEKSLAAGIKLKPVPAT